MGGRHNIKRRYLEAWAWYDGNTSGVVDVSAVRPKKLGANWHSDGATWLCQDVFEQLASQRLKAGARPIRVRIPPWTVLKGEVNG